MKKLKYFLPLAVMLPSVALVACGGSDSGTGSSTSGSRTVGVVTSVDGNTMTVGKTTFDTSNATVSGDVSSSTTAAIDPGMVVVVDGPVDKATNHGTANHVDYDAEVQGEVITNDCMSVPVPCTMDVMGQTVQVTETTEFKSEVAGITGVDMIMEGAYVEVSGYADGNGNIVATYVKVEDDHMEAHYGMEVEGMVTNLDATAGTFDIGGQTIHYDPATITLVLEEGMNVEVHLQDDGMGNMVAVDIKVEDDDSMGGQEGDDVEISGMVTSDGVVDGMFDINGETVMLSDNVEYNDDLTQDSIVKDAILEVEGYLDENNMLVVTEISAGEPAEDQGSGTMPTDPMPGDPMPADPTPMPVM